MDNETVVADAAISLKPLMRHNKRKKLHENAKLSKELNLDSIHALVHNPLLSTDILFRIPSSNGSTTATPAANLTTSQTLPRQQSSLSTLSSMILVNAPAFSPAIAPASTPATGQGSIPTSINFMVLAPSTTVATSVVLSHIRAVANSVALVIVSSVITAGASLPAPITSPSSIPVTLSLSESSVQ